MDIPLIAPGSPLRKKFEWGPATREKVYLKLAQMTKNGMPVVQALAVMVSLANERGNKKTQVAILKRWHQAQLDGTPLSDAAEHDLPHDDRVLLRAGEKSGAIASAVENILYLAEAKKRMRGAVKAGLSYPVVLLVLAFVLMNFVTYMMVPTYADFSPPETWTGAAGALASGAWFASHLLPGILVLLLGALAVAIWSMPRWTGESRKVADRFFPFSLYKLTNGTGFLIALGGLLREGVRKEEALETIAENGTPWYQERVLAARNRMTGNGENIATALFNTGFDFPDKEIVDDLRAFEAMDDFDKMIEKLARDALETAISRIKSIMKIMFNISIACFGAVLIWYLLGMFGMNSVINDVAGK